MTSNRRLVVANLDLDADVFAAIHAALTAGNLLPGTAVLLEDFAELGPTLAQDGIELFALYSRRADSSLPSLSRALARIGAVDLTLEQMQARHAVRKITLVDCGELPCAPLSDFNAVAQYLEAFAENLETDAAGGVMALDFDLSGEPAQLKLLDTQSPDFVDHFVAYTKQTLRMLNSGFGQGDLPGG
ncbi:MAG: hypothetical protein MUE98_07060 [Rhodobacteraceae bacterium]|jgi:hypothetical protein|nr:hypothetical protein [Paracoccaceae bacterium]